MDIDGTLRWVLWLIFVAFALFLYFSGPGQSGVGSGHLSLAIEVTLFALGTAAATLRAAKLYPEHDVRGGARPPRPTSLPFSWWHGYTGITVAIDQSYDPRTVSATLTASINIAQVLSKMEAEQRVNLVFLDACRDNPFGRSTGFGQAKGLVILPL